MYCLEAVWLRGSQNGFFFSASPATTAVRRELSVKLRLQQTAVLLGEIGNTSGALGEYSANNITSYETHSIFLSSVYFQEEAACAVGFFINKYHKKVYFFLVFRGFSLPFFHFHLYICS